MKVVKGILKEIGQSNKFGANTTSKYLYLEIGDEMIKNITTFDGLDGKFRGEMGNDVTAYFEGGYLVAFTDKTGKTFSSTKPNILFFLINWAFIILGIVTIPFLGIGLLFLYWGFTDLKKLSRMKSGSELPNAIEIPNR
jgi:hypothetical protein